MLLDFKLLFWLILHVIFGGSWLMTLAYASYSILSMFPVMATIFHYAVFVFLALLIFYLAYGLLGMCYGEY